MPISPCRLYKDFMGQNNTWNQGHYRVEGFEYAYYEAMLEIFNINRKEWETSQAITDSNRVFFKRTQITLKDFSNGGVFPYPADYAGFSALRYLSKKSTGGKGVLCQDIDILDPKTKECRTIREEDKKIALESSQGLYEKDIQKVDSQRWGSINEHEFMAPSVERPYATQDQGGFIVAPKGIEVVILSYLATPSRPVIKYKFDDRHNFVCVPEESKILSFGEEMLPELMSRMKKKFASFVGNAQKYAEGSKETQEAGS